MGIRADELFAKYPAYDAAQVARNLEDELAKAKDKVIVLDDDPTGIQTVHGVSVYTDWGRESVLAGVAEENRLFFILTNSRAFSSGQTITVHKEIAGNILAAAKDFLLVSRGDSTLRGHYPAETLALRQVLEENGLPVHGEIICPFFPEGGRYTAEDIHYVRYGDGLIPAGETEFARDRTFGYESSNLKEWVEEKTDGEVKAGDVASISLYELRSLDYPAIEAKLYAAEDFSRVIVNAISYDDIKVFSTALLRVMADGKRFILRSAAAIVKVIGGITDKPILERAELHDPDNSNGGLIVIGSHVQKTTDQLEALRSLPQVEFVELNQHLALDEEAFSQEVQRVVRLTGETIAAGKTAAVYTRRDRFDLGGGDKEAELKLATLISDKVTSIVKELPVRPSFLIAKGGITSSDIGVKGLGVRRAEVMGQILPGVPVWRTGPESRFPNLPYVIFPGNVGDESALKTAVEKML